MSNIRLYFIIALAVFLAVFLFLKIVPFGHMVYSRDYGAHLRSGKGFIYGFTPAERLGTSTDEAAIVIGDPVYFSLFTPRTFDKAKLTVVYRDNLSLDTPIIEAGVLADNIVWRYDLKPIENRALDYLMLRWHKSEDEGRLFLQKDKNYSSLSDWEKDLAAGRLKGCADLASGCLAVYNYSPAYSYRIPNYRPAEPLVIDTPLRGGHQLYVYMQDEPLRLEFSFLDRNQDRKPAPIKIILSKDGRVIEEKSIPDENLQPGSGLVEEKRLVMEHKSLAAGVYKIEVKITDDMVIKKISSSVDRLVFINKVWPVSSSGRLALYTDAGYIQAKALTPASLQTIRFAGKDFVLDEAYKQFDFYSSSLAGKKEIRLEKDDVILENNGVFAWSPDSLFNPALAKVDRLFSVGNPLEYIVADYRKPAETEGVKTATAEFNLKGAYRENGKYSFMISVPGLKAEDNIQDNLEIYKIKVELTGRTLWQKIWQR